VAISGTHRGSQGADEVCGNGNPFCNFFAQFIQGCDTATYWLRSSDDVQGADVREFTGQDRVADRRLRRDSGASACLSGEDDGIVQFASDLCLPNGSATTVLR